MHDQKNNICLSLDLGTVKQSLENQGFYIAQNVFTDAYCRNIQSFIDDWQDLNDTELHYKDTELRIWDPQLVGSSDPRRGMLQEFCQDATQFMSSLLRKKTELLKLLAIRNHPLLPGDTESEKGRWHLDSITNQVKIFLFLTDTNEGSGPFEFIPETFKLSFKLKMLLRGKYLRFRDLFAKGKRSYQKIDDAFIEQHLSKTHKAEPVLCPAGTVMLVNTTMIHRARPCYNRSRYALTAYF